MTLSTLTRTLCIATFLTLLALPCFAKDIDDELAIFDDPAINNAVENTHWIPNKSATPSTIVEFLIDINMVGILEENIFCHTNPLNQRPLADLPIFFTPRKPLYDWTVGTHFFWNKTNRCNFTSHSSCISSYVGFVEPSLIEKLTPTAKRFKDFNIDPISLFPLFQNMTVEERRIGLMMHMERQWRITTLDILVPLYYLERNFFLTDKEVDVVEKKLGKASEDDQEMFARKHMVSDKLGLGDTRIYLDVRALEHPTFNLRFGALTTLPTAVAFKRGLYGKDFCKNSGRPHFSFTELFDLGTSGVSTDKDKAAKIGEEFVLGTLDTLAANLLTTGLGNNRHFSIGIFGQPSTQLCRWLSRPWAEHFFMKGKLSLEYFFPAQETRLFVECFNKDEFNALGLNRSPEVIIAQAKADPAYAQQVLEFLQNKFIDKMNPFAFCTTVRPGLIFHWTSSFFFEGIRWGFYFGTDTWVQLQEKLYNIKVTPVDGRPTNPLDVAKATKPFAFQAKVHGALFYKTKRETCDWIISLHADNTVASSGIGKDYSVSLNFEANF
jgi:hypothetical protein